MLRIQTKILRSDCRYFVDENRMKLQRYRQKLDYEKMDDFRKLSRKRSSTQDWYLYSFPLANSAPPQNLIGLVLPISLVFLAMAIPIGTRHA